MLMYNRFQKKKKKWDGNAFSKFCVIKSNWSKGFIATPDGRLCDFPKDTQWVCVHNWRPSRCFLTALEIHYLKWAISADKHIIKRGNMFSLHLYCTYACCNKENGFWRQSVPEVQLIWDILWLLVPSKHNINLKSDYIIHSNQFCTQPDVGSIVVVMAFP